MAHKPVLSVVIPVFNEEESVDILVERLRRVLDDLTIRSEVVFVNDGSRDRTAQKLGAARAKDSRIRVLNLSRNFGHQCAISAGLDRAAGEVCVIMDGDAQDPPELIPKLLAQWKEGFEVVHAVRKERQGETFFKRWTAYGFYRILRMVTDVPISKDAGDFRLMDKKVVQALRAVHERSRFLRGLVTWVGFHQTEVYFVRESRKAGKTKFSLPRMWRFAKDAITSFSVVPLQMATSLGMLFSGAAFLYSLDVLYDHFVTGRTVAGWTSLMIVVLYFGGIQMMFLGVLGEYIGRIFEEVKQRPLYVIDSEEGFD